MRDQDFETALENDLRKIAGSSVRLADPMTTASAVVAAGRGARWRPGPTVASSDLRRLVWLVCVGTLLLLAVLIVLVVGSRGSRDVSGNPGRIAVISRGNLYSGDVAGNDLRIVLRYADGSTDSNYTPGDFKAVEWSPDGQYLAIAVGQQPGDTLWHQFAIVSQVGRDRGLWSAPVEWAWSPGSDDDVLVLSLTSLTLEDSPPSPEVLQTVRPATSGSAPGSAATGDPSATPWMPLEPRRSLGEPLLGLPLDVAWPEPTRAIAVLLTMDQAEGPDGERTVEIWRLDPSGALPSQKTGTTHGMNDYAISPDGSAIAVASTDVGRGATDEVRVIGLDGAEVCHVALPADVPTVSHFSHGLAWSRDGRRLGVAVDTRTGSELWVIDRDCSGARKLVSGSSTGYVVYDDSEDLQPGSALRVASGQAVRGPLEFTPDGRWLYYKGLTPQDQESAGLSDFDLRRISVDGGPSQLVARQVESFDLSDPPS